jgi:hypothetical protein
MAKRNAATKGKISADAARSIEYRRRLKKELKLLVQVVLGEASRATTFIDSVLSLDSRPNPIDRQIAKVLSAAQMNNGNPLPEIGVRELQWVLRNVRCMIGHNATVCESYLLARLTNERMASIGKRNKNGRLASSATRRAEAKTKYDDWHRRAAKIRQRNPKLSDRRVAGMVANQFPGDAESRKRLADQIRKKIAD